LEFKTMNILWTILIGFVIGMVAKMLMPGKDPSGFFITAALGILGSFVAKYLGEFMNLYQPNEPAVFVMSVIGAMLVLFAYHHLVRREITSNV